MQDLTDKVRMALAIYLQRGEAALQLLADGPSEEFFAIMTEREAAFQNFCALDALAFAPMGDDASLIALRRLWQDVDRINRTIHGTLHGRLRTARSGAPSLRQSPREWRSSPAALRLIKG